MRNIPKGRSPEARYDFESCSPFRAFLGLAIVTLGQAEDYYFYKGPKGKLVISNKEPPPGSQIIKHIPVVTDRKAPQVEETVKQQPNPQPEGSPKPSKTK